ncbi:MAG: hypothetical protein ABF391_09285 [Akkermansiaceae bacterium]
MSFFFVPTLYVTRGTKPVAERAVKRRPKTYQYLTNHRHTFKEIYHRES